jgi:two-component system cell cycle sensor histidine kinase/response regulator CckA
MGSPLRVLLIEDSEDDALLVLRELRQGGYELAWERVDTTDALNAMLTRHEWDAITCDWVMPQLTAPAALQVIKKHRHDVPIIIVSGEVGEEVAVTAMKAGAHDYVSKHNLTRLVPAIERELREAGVRRERTGSAAALVASERRVHQQLAEIEHIYRTTPVGICFLDCNLRYVRINERLAAMNGQPIDAHIGRTIHDVIPGVAATIEEVCRRALERREPRVDVEIRGASPANPTEQGVWLGSFYPVTAEDGSLLGLHALVVDVTERTRAEARLRASEERYRNLVETSHDLIWAVDAEGRYTFVNRAVRSLLGYEPDELIGRPFTDFLTPSEQRRALEALERIRIDGHYHGYQFEAVHKDGRMLVHRTNATVLRDAHGTVIGLTGTTTDVTNRVRAEEALQRSERHFRALIENASDLISILSNDGTIRYASPSHMRVLGYQPEEIVGQSAFDFVHPDDVTLLLETFQHAVLEAGTSAAEFRFRHRDGSWCYLEGIAKNALEDPVVAGMIINTRDISARKRVEAEVAYQAHLLANVSDAIIASDAQVRVRAWNRAAEVTYGWTAAETLGQPAEDFLQTEFIDKKPMEVGRIIAETGCFRGEVTQRRKGGTRFPAEVAVMALRDAGGAIVGYVTVSRDITERQRIEAELRQAQKLEAIGRLAGGVAHDFNNQLTIIKGCAQFLLSSLPTNDQRREDAQRISETVERGARLVRQLLTFSRLGPVETQPVNLADLITEMAPMLRLLLGEQMLLRIHGAPDLWPVSVDRSQIEQVLMNLVGNARDAMVPGGEPTLGQTVTIETGNVELDRWTHALPEGVRPGLYVALVVSDDGPGMPLEVQDHVFEPFFTTKGHGKGTGLGLATVYGIVKQHAGYVACASELGRGTRFEIYFPRDDRDAARTEESEPVAPLERSRAQKEWSILVAEDDENVRDVLVRALAESGYWVYSAAQSEDALAVAARSDRRLDLLVTDVIMPGGSGYALARRLLEAYPALRVLFVSGYYAERLDPSEIPGARFLGKPFGLDELLRAVAEMFADSDPARPAPNDPAGVVPRAARRRTARKP